jgi:hypothetical protein
MSTPQRIYALIAAGCFCIGFILVQTSESDSMVYAGVVMIMGALVSEAWLWRRKKQEPSSPPTPAALEAEHPAQPLAASDAQPSAPPTPAAARSVESAPPDALQEEQSTLTAGVQPTPAATGPSAERDGMSTLQTTVLLIAAGVFFIGGFLAKVADDSDPVGKVGIVMALGALAVILLGGWLFRRKKREPSSPPAPASPEAEHPAQPLASSDAQAATPTTPTSARSLESVPPDALQDQPSTLTPDESWAAPEPPEPPQAPTLT